MEQKPTHQQLVMRLCMETGRMLLVNGAEIFRVQETMERMASAFGAHDFHVYVITNGLFASVGINGENGANDVAFVPASRVHLGRLHAINNLSRDVEAKKVSLEEAIDRLEKIKRLPFFSGKKRILACGMGTACFAYLFGGTPLDALVAFFAGVLMMNFAIVLEKNNFNKIMYNILTAACVALFTVFCVNLFAKFGIALHMSEIIIGGIIPLVPGMALTTAIRDFAGGDYLSGTIRMIDAVLIACSIAIGVGGVFIATSSILGMSIM